MIIFDYICYFFLYSFLGWCLEVVYAAVQKRKFVNGGLLNSCFCPVYGCSMVFFLIFFGGLKDQGLFLFLACFSVASVFEWGTGMLLEKLFGQKCWDYSGYRDHIGTYVCIRFSAVWAAGAVLSMWFLQPLAEMALRWMPELLGRGLAVLLLTVLLIDLLATVAVLRKRKLQNEHITELAKGLWEMSRALDNAITRRVEARMHRVFPTVEEAREEQERKKLEKEAREWIFAYGCGFHKLVWLFFLGAFLGDVTETVFCLATTGRLMSRSSVVYGPFSIVWGAGIAGFTLLLHRYQDKKDASLFFLGTVLGGVYEYICSVFTELVFGTVFWDYSALPFNLGGRINLLYCFFWGIAAWVWMKRLYPLISRWIEKIPKKAGKILTWIFLVFMVWDIGISALALARYGERAQGIPPAHELAVWLDREFPDERMDEIYPSAKTMEEVGQE